MVTTLARRFSFIVAFALIAASALSCDFLALALPQGAANAAFSYADPRIEKSVRVKDLDEPFGLAVAPDGRAFVIARSGVNEYDAELTLVRTYMADAAQSIPKQDSGGGQEDWQFTELPTTPATIRLYGTKSGTVLTLMPSSESMFTLNTGYKTYYSYMLATNDFFETPWELQISGTTVSIDDDFLLAPPPFDFNIAFSPQSAGFESGATPNDSRVFLTAQTMTFPEGPDMYSAILEGTLIGSLDSPPPNNLGVIASYTTSPLPYDMQMHRLYPFPTRIAMIYGSNDDLSSYRSVCLLFDRFAGGAPLAALSLEGVSPVPFDGGVMALGGNDKSFWLHRLRWLP